ncbi:hypothetical protein QQG74_22585 [Micromonospora sp. FIMYZ51]|uniref:hypothetical protein n=1 Tax=Micromonospora sp. FIMYZ51 TaxID=3051832 RepID=UPI00311FB9C6
MMAEVVGGDLYRLWRVSEVHLPRIADVYYDAARTVAGARGSGSSSDADAFRDSTPVYPGSSVLSSPVGAAWAQLRNELQHMYTQIGDTVQLAGDGIRDATQAYLDTDQVNADALRLYLNDPRNHNLDDPASNPPAVGDDDHPGTAPPLP